MVRPDSAQQYRNATSCLTVKRKSRGEAVCTARSSTFRSVFVRIRENTFRDRERGRIRKERESIPHWIGGESREGTTARHRQGPAGLQEEAAWDIHACSGPAGAAWPGPGLVDGIRFSYRVCRGLLQPWIPSSLLLPEPRMQVWCMGLVERERERRSLPPTQHACICPSVS